MEKVIKKADFIQFINENFRLPKYKTERKFYNFMKKNQDDPDLQWIIARFTLSEEDKKKEKEVKAAINNKLAEIETPIPKIRLRIKKATNKAHIDLHYEDLEFLVDEVIGFSMKELTVHLTADSGLDYLQALIEDHQFGSDLIEGLFKAVRKSDIEGSVKVKGVSVTNEGVVYILPDNDYSFKGEDFGDLFQKIMADLQMK